MYSTYEFGGEQNPRTARKSWSWGGPNRIGQGIKLDYCCVHAALAMREDGYETIMVNCSPETVSTDFIHQIVYFEPLTLEDVLEIADIEKPAGVIVQFGGQTLLKPARALEAAAFRLLARRLTPLMRLKIESVFSRCRTSQPRAAGESDRPRR